MKIWNKFLLPGLLIWQAAICISCSEDAGEMKGYEMTGNYLSFQLNTTTEGGLTRAIDDLHGLAAERKVSSVHMLLYNTGGNSAKLMYNFRIQASTDGTTKFQGTDVVERGAIISLNNQFVSAAKPVLKQDYQLVILVNATPKILAKAKAEEDYSSNYNILGDLLEVVEDSKAEDFFDVNGENFFMANAGGVIHVPESNVKQRKTDAEDAAISVAVERLVSKVLVYENTSSSLEDVTLGGKVGAVSWGIDVENKQTYLVRIQDKLKNGTQETGFETDRNLVYAKDPNFNDNATIIANSTLYDKHFKMLDLTDANAFLPWNANNEPVTHYQYILENTMSLFDQQLDQTPKKYTTQIILKIIITEPAGLPGVTNYYSYHNGTAWKVFTHEQAVEWYAEGIPAKQTFPSDMVGLAALITDADQLAEFDFTQNTGAPIAYTHTDLGLTYHAGGLNMYSIPIMHFGAGDNTIDEDDYGYYGVVRNNTYRIIINSINGPGTLTEYENISVDISINEWHPRDSDEDLKPGR